jgi:hypothetical protein
METLKHILLRLCYFEDQDSATGTCFEIFIVTIAA